MSFGNTAKDGSGDAYWLLLDTSGRLNVVGAAAEDAAAAGNPLLAGGRYDSTARDLDTGDVGALALNADAQVIVDDGWAPSLQSDETVDDSDKSFTVPASTRWRIQSIWVELISSADAGNRQLGIEIQDSASDVVLQVRAGIVQAASITRYYLFAPHVTELTAFRDTDQLTTIFPELELPAGYVVRVWDTDAIAAAADDMVVQMMVKVRTV